jgi:hypothetical protein
MMNFLTLWTGFILSVLIHIGIVVLNAVSFFVLPFKEPWYVAVPCVSVIFFLTFNRGTCPLTSLENFFRKKLGLPQIRGFVGHYILRRQRENQVGKN